MLRLAKIEVSGFKSFAVSEAIDFSRPVTAVVGPNGSGKSNLLDAVLFAFGEQSAHRIRTSKMDAVIFAGAGDTRKLNFTSVKLTFSSAFDSKLPFKTRLPLPGENGREPLVGGGGGNGNGNGLSLDGSVTLERRLYRDGVSEYLLNGEAARLKDVDEFFAPFGMGRSALLAITQGEVERKILANEQEMRSWLVSACGVGLLIDRKKRTEEKLERTRLNLERVSELIASTRRRLDALSRERNDAFEYEALNRKLAVLKLEGLRRDLAECFKSLAENQATVDEIKGKLALYGASSEDAAKAKDAAEAEFEAARAAIEARMGESADAQRMLDEADARVGALEVEARMLAEAIKTHARIKAETAELLQKDESRLKELKTDAAELEKKAAALEKDAAAFKSRLDEGEAAARAARVAYDKAISAKLACEKDVRDLEHRLAMAVDASVRAKASAAKHGAEFAKLESGLGDARLHIDELEREKATAYERLKAADAGTCAAAAALDELKRRLENAREVRDALRGRLAGVDARLDSLNALEAEAEGFAPGKKALLTDAALAERIGGATDPWRGIVFPPELAGAVGLVLAMYEDSVEVGDILEGVRVLAEFAEKGIGRVRLLASRDNERSVVSGAVSANGESATKAAADSNARPDWRDAAIERFYDAVSGDDDLIERVRRETGEVAIADSLDDARRMLETHDEIERVVLRDGSVMVARGEAVGGAPSAGSAVLSRRGAIDALARARDALERDLAASNAEFADAQSGVANAQAELDGLSEAKALQAKELAVIDERLRQARAREKEMRLNLDSVRIEIAEVESEIARLDGEVKLRRDEKTNAMERLTHSEKNVERVAEALTDCERLYHSVRDEHAHTQEDLRVAHLNAAHVESQTRDLDRRVRDARAQIKSADAESESLNAKLTRCETDRAKARGALELARGALDARADALIAARKTADALRARLDELKTAARDAEENRTRFERDLARFDVTRGRLLYRYYDLWKSWHDATIAMVGRQTPSYAECGCTDGSVGRKADYANYTGFSDADLALINAGVSPAALAIANEALTLARAFCEAQGIVVAEPKLAGKAGAAYWVRMGFAPPFGDERDGSIGETGRSGANAGDARDAYAETLYGDVERIPPSSQADALRPRGDVGLAGTVEAASAIAGDSAEQMHIEDAPEVTISGWETYGAPEPPLPPSLLADVERMGKGALRDAIAECERAIGRLGSVNLKAPAQWDEESMRLSFFVLQEADVRKALEDLTNLLASLDVETLAKYHARAEKIGARFRDYFKFLFGSGDATVSFTEPDNVLESGVEVYVTLPGDRRQPLRSLSGGERSLIFLALFLAAHATGASAFCIMDEADAALDDANILRLGRLLDAIAAHTQLILITHNKRTMELADGLVGIVGRPKGVSRVIPVNLAKAQEYAEAGVASG